jgi:maleate isomerase
MASPHRIGLIVPSSNVTVETEMPALLARHATAQFSFHSSRMRMHTVSPDELAEMNLQRSRCVDEIADAGVDAVLYGCLVAIMAGGSDAHRRLDGEIRAQLTRRGATTVVLSSAGALLDGLAALGAKKVALVTPYLQPLAELVVGYIEAAGYEVIDYVTLEVADNAQVGRIPPERTMGAARALTMAGADALVISACVQMPSLALIDDAEREFGLPVISAATAAAYSLLTGLGLDARAPGAGRLLAPPTTSRSALQAFQEVRS